MAALKPCTFNSTLYTTSSSSRVNGRSEVSSSLMQPLQTPPLLKKTTAGVPTWTPEAGFGKAAWQKTQVNALLSERLRS